MILLSLAATTVLSGMLLIALWNLATAPRLERAGLPRRYPTVSLLVPARNEAENLRTLLPALLGLDYPALEILVLDDGSEDETSRVVESHAEVAGGRLRLLRGKSLPEGWLGKSWACQQLAEAGVGDVLVFCDADVVPRSDAVLLSVATMEAENAGVLTALPRQRLGSWVEAAVVPLITQLPVLTLLPLSLVPRLRAASLSMANGQWLAFTRGAYHLSGGHAVVRGDVVEDVALARRAKEAGLRLLPVIATSALEVRMYRSGAELRDGFRKNLFALLGGRPGPVTAGLAVFLVAAVYPWAGVLVSVPGASIALALLVAVRGCGALFFRHGLRSVLLHPIGALLLLWIALESCYYARRGLLSWKGRSLAVRANATL